MDIKKINRLKRITSIAENNEKLQVTHWKNAKNALEFAANQLDQLKDYYKSYAPTSTSSMDASFYMNRRVIVDMMSSAILEQRCEVDRLEVIESNEYLELKEKNKEKKIHEKLIQHKILKSLDANRKNEAITLTESCVRFSIKNHTQENKSD